ncbi:MAG: hypothetical protein ACRD07_04720 [Acidimicrobiales bacterium]
MTKRPKWVQRTEEAIDEHTAPSPGERKYAVGPRAHTADRGALRREQQDEVAQAWAGAGLGAMTDAQVKGLVVGAILGGLCGALLFLPLGLIGWAGISLAWRLALAALCGAFAGAVGGALYLGGREPELEGETRDVDDRPSIGTTLRDPHTDPRGR